MISRLARRDGPVVTKPPQRRDKPPLFVDIDGVISRGRLDSNDRPEGTFHNVDGVMHSLSSDARIDLLALADGSVLVWCSGRQEKADEHLPHALALPGRLAFLSCPRDLARADAPSAPAAGLIAAHVAELHGWPTGAAAGS